LPDFSPFAELFRGWALIFAGRSAEGLRHVKGAAEAVSRAGACLYEPHALLLLAEGYQKAGQPDDARRTLDEAFAAVGRHGRSWCEAELHRLNGLLTLEAPVTAERCFQAAIRTARRQQAKMPELRARLNLGQLWLHAAREREAHALVHEIYEQFTEGFDAPDLVEARRFLDATA
jgi:predicted ATPase